MKTQLNTSAAPVIDTECLVAVSLDHAQGEKAEPQPKISDLAVAQAAAELLKNGEVTGKSCEMVLLHAPAGMKAKRLLIAGGGKAKDFSSYDLRKVTGAAARYLKQRRVRSVAFLAPPEMETSEAVRAIVEGVFVGDFDPDTYKSDRKDESMNELTVVASSDARKLQPALEQAVILGESQNFTRELVNEPGNRMTPTMLASRARQMCQEVKSPYLKCEILDGEAIRKLKMGAFWSVAQGSDEPPALIVMRYSPPGAAAKPVIGLVGKGITFDSGGISLKPGEGMEKMKYDMAGGAAMIGAMRAIALLQPRVNVIAVVCATENMPSGKAQKPGDVQIAMSGKSIEIINTDAEGRLVLADGLYYARQLGCTHLIDAATLTGAVVVALGMTNAGVFSNDDATYQRFAEALGRSGEKMWRLPVDDEYQELIRGSIADIINSAGRWGGAITAAMFLKEFVGDTPWIHLDIAGVAWMEENKPWIAKGPTGVAVRSLVEFVKGFESTN